MTGDEPAAANDDACTSITCYCPVSGLMETLGRKYALHLVCIVGAHGTPRFSDVERHLPEASTSTLSTRLEELAEHGIVSRTQYDEVPPRVEYELTDEGAELARRLEPLLAWVEAQGS